MATMLEKFAIIAGLAGSLLTGAYFVEDRYEEKLSHSADKVMIVTEVAQLDDKLELKIIQDDLRQAQSRIWQLEDKEEALDAEQKKSLKELRAEEDMLKVERGRVLERMDSRSIR